MTLKHSKIKNTGLLFDILAQQVVSEALSNKKNTAYRILQKHFKAGTTLSKELKLYQAIAKSQEKDSKFADRLLEVVKLARQQFDKRQLDYAKYKLVGDLKKYYDIKVLLETKVPSYILNANIYKYFEYSSTESPVQYVEVYSLLQEHITSAPNIAVKDTTYTLLQQQDRQTKQLAHKIILEKFNSKYKNLNTKQKALLARFINTNSDNKEFKDYVIKEASSVRSNLLKKKVLDPTVKIKLQEAIGLIEKIIAAKAINNEHLSALLKYYELDQIL